MPPRLVSPSGRSGEPSAQIQRASATGPLSVKTASVPLSETEITSVSCWSATGCMAVGYAEVYGTDEAYATKWNGHTWSAESVPQYKENGEVEYQDFYGVSCWSATGCMAVGYSESGYYGDFAVTATWNGSKWTLHIAETTAEYGQLSSVSCRPDGPSAMCEAVGEFNGKQLLAMTWDGSAWSENTVPTLSQADGNYLYGVSCASTTVCVAVGTTGYDESLLISWDATSWVQDYANNPGDDNYLYSVSCGSATTCTAVGAEYGNEQYVPLIQPISVSGSVVNETGNSLEGADPFLTFAELEGVSCSSASACVAVGYGSNDGYNVSDTFAEAYNGHSWKRLNTATPGQSPEDALAAVSCTSSTSCVAGGWQWSTSTTFVDLALAESLTKGAFVVGSVAVYHTPESELSAISCPSSKMCIAVGYFYTGDGDVALTYLWNGKTWRLVVTPDPGVYESWLSGVSCTSATFCMLVGTTDGFDYYDEAPLVLTYDGSSFSAESVVASTIDGEDPGLAAVSCTSSKACVAVGVADNSPFSLSWNGKTLAASVMPMLYDYYADPDGLSCVSTSKCYATFETYVDGGGQSYIEVWNGASWSDSLIRPQVTDATEIYLNGVSCVSTKRCVVVGQAYTTSDEWEAISGIFNGSKWTTQVVANPSTTSDGDLGGVDCTSSKSCVSVGSSYVEASERYVPMAVTLSGTKWSKQTSAGTAAGYFAAVACPTSSLCFAAGESFPSGDNDKALLEQDKNGKWSAVT